MNTGIFYFIVAHQYPLLVAELVRSLQSVNSIICIHIDKKSDINEFKAALTNEESYYFLEERVSIHWSGFSQVEATLLGMKECVKKKANHFVLLSGQDVLIKPLNNFEEFLTRNKNKSFIDSGELEKNWKEALTRVKIFYFEDFFRSTKNKLPSFSFILNKVEGLTHKLQFFVKRKAPFHYTLYGGSSWMMLHSQAITYILQILNDKPNLLRFFKYSQCADEIFFQTVLENSHLKQSLEKKNYRYIHFEANKDNPSILDLNDYEALKKSDAFFARKIHPEKSAELIKKLKMNHHA